MIRRFVCGWAVVAVFCLAVPALASAAPQPVGAWYMYSTSPSALRSEAYYHGYNFARRHPGGTRLMVLDFGAARKVGSSTWGSVSFGSPSTAFSNTEILAALRAAADGIHDGYVWGMTIVAYGNSNYHMASSGMSGTDAYFAGYFQSQRANDLAAYQQTRNYNKQGSAAASDIEPSWESASMSRRLVDGVSDQGWALLYNFGSADGCPLGGRGSGTSCNNGWTVDDVGYVSYHGSAVPLPEIYYLVNANQWTYIRDWWNKHYGMSFTFWGVTAEVASDVLTPAQSWSGLNDRNPGAVFPELICFGY